MEKINNLEDLLFEQVNGLNYTKKRQVKNLEELRKKATAPDLKNMIQQYQSETNKHIDRLKNVFNKLNQQPTDEKYEGIDGLINETNNLISKCQRPEVIDAAIIKCLQQINHYEISSFGSACTYAQELDQNEVAGILHDSLDEEKSTDRRFSEIATETVNEKAC